MMMFLIWRNPMQIIRGMSLASLFLLVGTGTLGKAHAQHSQHGSNPHAVSGDRSGVLVMAHGGIPEWDAGVLETLQPLREKYPLEVAFGMADAYSLQEAVTRLEHQGVTDIAVVRLFISGESWYERTQQILGLIPGAPEREAEADAAHSAHGHGPSHGDAAAHGGHRMEFWRVQSSARFQLSTEGLSDAEQMSEVLLTRATDLSKNPATEDVLILAHGPEDDAENERWIASINERAQLLRERGGFNDIHVATLREDWPEKRELAQAQVRDFISRSRAEGRTPIVIPYRVHGFGPYAEALEGLDYVSDGKGLIPHPAVTDWIEEQILLLTNAQLLTSRK